MLHRRELLRWFTLVLIIACPLALWGADREKQEPRTPIARLEVQPARVDWLPHVDYELLFLTVAGPEGLYIQREFGPGETPAFSSLDVPDGHLPDGVYAYELRAGQRLDQTVGDGLVVKELQKEVSPSEKPLVQSGHLWVQGGSFIDRVPIPPDHRSGSTHPPNSVSAKVVQGRTCIGADCLPGDDNVPALKLKELFDTRITFENSGCCHPSTRTWALQANDVSNTNGDFLIRDLTAGTIPFRIGERAPDNALTIYPFFGYVGLGTLTPANKLHVMVSTPGQGILVDGDQPTDVAVNIIARGDSAALILNDLQGGTNQKVVQQFVNAETWRIRGLNDAVTTETVPGIVLSLANGNVGINCQSAPGADLVVDDGGACNAGTRSQLNAGDLQFTNPSSRSLKENLAPVKMEGILGKMSQIQVYSYDYIKGPRNRIGLMAEDFHTIFGRGSDKMINGDEVQIALWLAVQELVTEKETLQRENAGLTGRLATLEALVARLINEKESSAQAEPSPAEQN